MAMVSERQPLTGRVGEPRWRLSARTGMALLLAAAACAIVAEVAVWDGEGARGKALVSVGGAAPSSDKAGAEGKQDKGYYASFDKGIRGIPVVGEPLASGIKKIVAPEPRVVDPHAKKVKVEFYMEALCPGCQYFTSHVLAPVLHQKGMSGIVDLHVYPAGNGKIKADRVTGRPTIHCQHGEEECLGNRILSCLSHMNREHRMFVPTFACIEQGDSSFSDSLTELFNTTFFNATQTAESRMGRLASKCMAKGGIESEPVLKCANSPEGLELAESYLNATQSLKPAFEYAPWVVINGQPIREDAYSFKEYVCKAYKGVLPAECSPSRLKDYFPKHETLRATQGGPRGARGPGAAKAEAGLGERGHKQLLAAWSGGSLFSKCSPNAGE